MVSNSNGDCGYAMFLCPYGMNIIAVSSVIVFINTINVIKFKINNNDYYVHGWCTDIVMWYGNTFLTTRTCFCELKIYVVN